MVEHFNRIAGDALSSLRSIGVGTQLLFDDEYGQTMKRGPENACQHAEISGYQFALFLATSDYSGINAIYLF